MAEGRRDPEELPNRPGFWRSSLNPWTVRTRDNPERVAFVLHRVTGFIILAFLLAHILRLTRPSGPCTSHMAGSRAGRCGTT
ncbi:MAG: hypothetical protein CISAcid_14060 [uncultured Acidilobus sp. CIS]|nr:MAG: hypothetical protein CISAcid_14060 [uncultured Acidilobus sp. CIS]